MTVLINDYPAPACGLGVTLNWVIWRMHRLYPAATRVNINKPSNPYCEPARGPNVWDYYFDQPDAPDGVVDVPKEAIELSLSGHRDWTPAAVEALRRVSSRIRLRPEVQARVDAFRTAHFKGRVLGIHLRGTDKLEEYRPMKNGEIIERVRSIIADKKPDTVFLQTDDIEYWKMMQCFSPVSLELPRSKLAQHHHPKLGRYEAGLSAVVDGFLGAACDWYAYTPSNFATISIIMGRHETIDRINRHCEIMPMPDLCS